MNLNDLIQSVSRGLVQNNRILKLDTPLGKDVLLPLRLVGHSRIGRNYGFKVDTVSTASQIELKQLIAQPVTLWMQQTDQSYLPHHGYVHTASRLGADGSTVYTQLEFSSWLHFLKFRKDARIWQDKTVEDVLSDVFEAHPQARGRYRFALYNTLPNRSFCMQYEDDWNFVHRIMESEGLWSYFEQAPDGQSHTLVITDLTHFCKPLEPSQIAFSRSEVTSETDTLTQWTGTRTLQSVKYTPVTGDYKSPGDHRITYGQTMPNQGRLPEQMEVYEYTGAYSHLDFDRGDHLNRIRIEEWESRAKRFFGTGGVRRVDAGRWFEFVDHPDHQKDKQQDRSFLIIETRWFIENNLPLGNTRQFPGSLETELERARAAHQSQPTETAGSEGFFLTQIEAQRWAIPFHSPYEHNKPHMRMQSATVVGPAGEEVYTDALNRIKVKFRWDRLASGDETSSCWIRVMQSDTGSGYGGAHVPRVGEEIYVDWDGGDCDRPIVIGRAYNGAVQPAWHTSGILSGFRSKEYSGGGFNQLVLDDSTGQTRTQLMSSSANSMLHLGYMINQNGNVRGSYLGSGFDLKTDAYGAVRANRGLYVTTYSKSANSPPMDAQETRAQLNDAGGLVQSLSDVSVKHNAETLAPGHDALKQLLSATDHSTSGEAKGGLTAGGGLGTANAFNAPVLVLGSPADIGVSSQKNTHVQAGQHVNLVSGQSTHLAAGKSLIASVAEKISLFAQKAGIKIFAAQGPVAIQAQGDQMALGSLKDFTITSSDGKVILNAAKEVWIGAGGSYIQINANGIINGSSGPIIEKTPRWSRSVASTARAPLPVMPLAPMDQPSNNLYTQTFDVSSVVANRATGTVLDGKPYRIYLPDGTLHQQGMLTDGATVPVRTGQSVNVKCEIGDGDWSAIEDAYDHDDIAHDNA